MAPLNELFHFVAVLVSHSCYLANRREVNVNVMDAIAVMLKFWEGEDQGSEAPGY